MEDNAKYFLTSSTGRQGHVTHVIAGRLERLYGAFRKPSCGLSRFSLIKIRLREMEQIIKDKYLWV